MKDAGYLLAALKARHADDVIVPECKDGATQTRSHRRFDAWVLVKTWSPITTIGYEIKVSRSDWRRDEKLATYAGLAHLLYVVAPKGVVPIEELPTGVGLLEAVGEATPARLVTRRKAARREIDIPVTLLLYVLMSRVTVKDEDHPYLSRSEHPQAWRVRALQEWAAAKDDRRELHHALGEKIRERFHEQDRRQVQLEEKLKRLEHIEARIRELGFNPEESYGQWKVTGRLNDIARIIQPGLLETLKRTAQELERTRGLLDVLRNGVPADSEAIA